MGRYLALVAVTQNSERATLSEPTKWYQLPPERVFEALASRRSGLTEQEVQERLSRYGTNELNGRKKTSPVMVFLRQFLSPLVYVLVAASAVNVVIGKYTDAIVILITLLIMAAIGFIQETRAERAMDALLRLAAPKARVRRAGQVLSVDARGIVPGDIILLEAGDRVPADALIVEASNLKVNESLLTGESMPVDKHTDTLSSELAVADRKNMVFMGTTITYGRAAAVVVSTGMSSEIGRIAGALREVKPEPTPLQRSINNLGRYIIIITGAACALLVAAGFLRGLDWLEVFLIAVAAAVSAIPEGLPATMTVVLAVGMRLMAQRHAIIRQLVAVETLGSATVICSDKTGTLTLNQMTVKRLWTGGRWIDVTGEGYLPQGELRVDGRTVKASEDEAVALVLRIGALCNDALLTTGDRECCGIMGDPTEGALVVAAAKAGFEKERLELHYPRLDEIPFQSERRYMATLHPRDGGKQAYVKGAPERLLEMSGAILYDGAAVPLTAERRRAVLEAVDTMAREAMRVIAVAYVDLPAEVEELHEDSLKGKLVLAGLAGMADPPREEAKTAIKLCKQAGIRVVMITGDNRITAESVARQLELPPGRAITGQELQAMGDDELAMEAARTSVFARIEPLHKLRIVKAFKRLGEVVAMTGDGVNDAPALKAADIGIAMGLTGTDVAKEASNMVLADDNFASIVAAVEEGRAIFNRLRNVLFFLLSTGLGSLLALIFAVLTSGKAPLTPIQIIWVNLVTGTIIAIPLGLEPKIGDELSKPPRHPKVNLVFPGLLIRTVFVAFLMSMPVFLLFNWADDVLSLPEARTIAFCTMVVVQWFIVFSARSDEYSIFKLGLFRNRWLILALLGALVLQLIVIYVPFLRPAFHTAPIGWFEWGLVVVSSFGVFVVEALVRAVFPGLFLLGKWRPVRGQNATDF